MDQQWTGFFGKVPSHGDFVSRRLPEAFLQPWDRWLQGGLQCSRERLGERWLEVYLCSPVWRFALAGGVCGESGWAGVMIPSVDRVGRYFPLTVAVAGEDVPLVSRMELDAGWYDEVERLALSTLAEDGSLAGFDSGLRGLVLPSRVGGGDLGRSLFWTDGSPLVGASAFECLGLPGIEGYADMLGGTC